MGKENYPQTTVGDKHVFALKVLDNHTGEVVLSESLVDHITITGGTLEVEVNSHAPLPGDD